MSAQQNEGVFSINRAVQRSLTVLLLVTSYRCPRKDEGYAKVLAR